MTKCDGCQVEISSCDFHENKNRCKKCLKSIQIKSNKINNLKRNFPESEDSESLRKNLNSEIKTVQPRRSARLGLNLDGINKKDADKEIIDTVKMKQTTKKIKIRSKSIGTKTRTSSTGGTGNGIDGNSSADHHNHTSSSNNSDNSNIQHNTTNTSSNNNNSSTNNRSNSNNPNSNNNNNNNNNSSGSNNPNPRQSESNNIPSPIISLSFGFARVPFSATGPAANSPFSTHNATAIPVTSLPPDIQQLFNNLSGNFNNVDMRGSGGADFNGINVGDITRMFQRASNQAAGPTSSSTATGTATASTATDSSTSTNSTERIRPRTRSATRSTTDENVRTSASASGNINMSSFPFTSNPENEMDFLGFAHQMFQLISSARPSQNQNQNQANPRIFHSFISLPMSVPIGGGVNNFSNTFNVEADGDIENVLNEFFSRIFGGMEAARGPIGLTSERISALPETPLNDFDFDCSICRENVTKESSLSGKCVQLPCKHNFHFECIDPWLRRVPSCPICRAVIGE